ncbi:putative auxin efflux carrier [Lyophyllum shimeji]|uniref:Auxin efflux carrier n=1 Tax=Lyophyllum shimeji TaxID=47721 RepID=A0A9P3UKZ9_LYOSH|nr:putative auxin efflux carrier [Lyophyllum shimeji]
MLSAGELIWASCRPLIRLVLCVASGFILTKTDNFPPVAARGAGQVMLNIALPCLMFSRIVPAFTSDNISALGPLVLVAVLYEALGILMAWITKQLFWVPHRFRYGILVAGGWGNVGDIPTSVIVSVTGAAPFNGTLDQNLSVAYISAFILVFMLTLFPCGGHHWISMDYIGPDVEPEEVKDAVKRRRKAIIYALPNAISWITGKSPRVKGDEENYPKREWRMSEEEKAVKGEADATGSARNQGAELRKSAAAFTSPNAGVAVAKHVSFNDDVTTVVPTEGVRSPMCSPTPTEVGFDPSRISSPAPTLAGCEVSKSFERAQNTNMLPTSTSPCCVPHATSSSSSVPTQASPLLSYVRPVIKIARSFASQLLSPASLGILTAFPIALIPPLKGLFVDLPHSSSTSNFANPHIPAAPDGHPPLAVILDTASFIGGASVPLGLICLGSALARLKIPRNQWRTLPTGAIGMLAIGKLVVAPVIGVGIVKGLVAGGVIGREDKVLQFVCIFFSCLPTATTQVFLTQVYSGTGSAEHLSAFLIPQYILMFISMTGLTAYTLRSLF